MNQDSSRERVSGGGFARGWQRTHLVRQVLNWLRESSAGWGTDYLRVDAEARRKVVAGADDLTFVVVAAKPKPEYDGRPSL